MSRTTTSSISNWTAIAALLAAASMSLAQQGTGAAAPQGKPAASPSNAQPTPEKAKPAADTKAKPPADTKAKAGAVKVGEAAPEFSLKDGDGKTLALKDLRGKVVLLDFWATWCPPCRAVMPEIQKLHEQYGEKGLVVLGMNSWEGRGKLSAEDADARAIQYKHDNKFTYRGLLRADDTAKGYGVNGIPAMFLIGPDGKLVGQWVGADSSSVAGMKTAVKTAVEDLAKNPGAAKPADATGNKPADKK